MAKSFSVTDYRLTEHGRMQMMRRQISEDDVANVLSDPEQWEFAREGRMVYQSRIQHGDPIKTFLLRIFVDIDRKPPEVVTVYLTSKISKYWRTSDESHL